MKKLWQLQLQLCIGNKQPLPITGFPALPCYVFIDLENPAGKGEVMRLMQKLQAANPGYVFLASESKGKL